MMVMDEVAQYLTDGMGMMAQQARSLNVGLVFATQDFDSLHHANPRETDAILANTNIKVFMKAENPSASQIRSVLSSFVDRRRFEKSKFIDVLRAKKEGLTHRLTYEPRKIDRSDAYVSMQPDQAKAEALYALDEQGVRHYENAEPEDLALMLRGFRPGDMLVTYGSDMVVGRAGYVALDHGRGSEHEIRLPRMIHVSGYGQRAADARKLREDSEQVLASMRKGYDAQPRTPDYPMHAVLSNPERSIVDPRTVEDDNIRNIWAELLFVHLKGSFPEDLSDMICGYAKRRMVVLNHDDAVKMPTRKPSASGRRSSGTPVQYDVLKLFEDAA
jgi:hypothetical protein